jgi:hypothetical protein
MPENPRFEFDPDYLPPSPGSEREDAGRQPESHKSPGWLQWFLAPRMWRLERCIDRMFGLRRLPPPPPPATPQPGVRRIELREIGETIASWESAWGAVGCSIEVDPLGQEPGACLATAVHFDSDWNVNISGPSVGDNDHTRRALNRAAAFLVSLHAQFPAA